MEFEPDSNIMAYASSCCAVYASPVGSISDRGLSNAGTFYNYLKELGVFFDQATEMKSFRQSIVSIFYWFLEDAHAEPSISDIEIEYRSDLFETVQTIGETLNLDESEIRDAYERHFNSDFSLTLDDAIKEVLDEQGLSPIYLSAPGDAYLMVSRYFGAQTFMPDILNNLVSRRSYELFADNH